MKVLIIGGTRFIGKAITEKALNLGFDVTLFNRGQTKHELPVKTIAGDINSILDSSKEILSQNFDLIIHCIAYTEQHARDIRSIAKEQNTKLIVLSSCDCYEVFQGLNRKTDKTEIPVREDSELSQTKYYWRDFSAKGDNGYWYDKNLMTDILMEGFKHKEYNLTVFRLPMVYGPEDHQYPGRHGAIIQRILDKRKQLVLSDREQCQVYSFGYIDNLVCAIFHSLNHSVCNGKIYNLGETQSRTRRRWAELYSKICGWEFEIQILPECLLRKDLDFLNAPPQHLITDSSLFERDTQFVAPVSLKECIKNTFEYAKENPHILGEKPDYEKESLLISKYLEGLKSLLD